MAALRVPRSRFQSTLPVWGATCFLGVLPHSQFLFQSTLPVWGATISCGFVRRTDRISIHAPRVGSDSISLTNCTARGYFNPRSPCGERPIQRHVPGSVILFQSTLPVWGATPTGQPTALPSTDFNPRSPCGERRGTATRRSPVCNFNPRSPCGERHKLQQYMGGRLSISIHAPRVGSDVSRRGLSTLSIYFNPRSPCGERRVQVCPAGGGHGFQSTLPVWGATVLSDGVKYRASYFNPRSPCGERPGPVSASSCSAVFQSTLPVWGATDAREYSYKARREFQSTLPVWGATSISLTNCTARGDFNPRSPCGERLLLSFDRYS